MIESLTPRETQVWELLALGLSNQAIGTRLGITSKSVATHAHEIYQKLGVKNRTAATVLWVQGKD